jgi:hypothetical protein
MIMGHIRKYLKLDAVINRNIFYMLSFCMLALTLLRIIITFKNNPLIDFVCHVDASMAICHNLDPYNLKNLKLTGWDCPPIIFPGIFLFFSPFISLNLDAAKIIHLSLSIIAACCLVYLFFRKARMLDNFDYKKPDMKALLILFMAFIFLNSTPVMMTFRLGQNTIFLTLLLVLCLFCQNKWCRIILFSLAAITKYTMLTLLAPALFLKKNYLFCIVSFLVFLLFAISPALCGHNIIKLYSNYAGLVQQYVSTGFNTYAESGYSMLNMGFFKLNIINILGKLLFGLLAAYIIFRSRLKNSFGMNFLLAVMCITMLLSYHRLHDIHLIMLILLAEFDFFLLNKDKINMLISAIFIIFFAVPFSLVISISHLITKLPHIGDFFQICHYAIKDIDVFPLSAVVFLLLTIYSLYLYFFKKEEVIFELNESKPDGET